MAVKRWSAIRSRPIIADVGSIPDQCLSRQHGQSGSEPHIQALGLHSQAEHDHPANGYGKYLGDGRHADHFGRRPWKLFQPRLAAGTPILINGCYAHLAAPPTSSTTLITQENLGSHTGYSFMGANFGVVIAKTNASSANVDFSIGLNYAFSQMPTQGVNGDHEMINQASVSVTKSADGVTCGIYTVGCSGGVLSPPIPGYLGYLDSGAVFLWIPRNSAGSPRGETRLLSLFWKTPGSTRVNGNGDSISGNQLLGAAFFDDVDGTSIYNSDLGGNRVWRLSYNESYSGCAGYVGYHPWPPAGD